jgi:hypothetical protein
LAIVDGSQSPVSWTAPQLARLKHQPTIDQKDLSSAVTLDEYLVC